LVEEQAVTPVRSLGKQVEGAFADAGGIVNEIVGQAAPTPRNETRSSPEPKDGLVQGHRRAVAGSRKSLRGGRAAAVPVRNLAEAVVKRLSKPLVMARSRDLPPGRALPGSKAREEGRVTSKLEPERVARVAEQDPASEPSLIRKLLNLFDRKARDLKKKEAAKAKLGAYFESGSYTHLRGERVTPAVLVKMARKKLPGMFEKYEVLRVLEGARDLSGMELKKALQKVMAGFEADSGMGVETLSIKSLEDKPGYLKQKLEAWSSRRGGKIPKSIGSTAIVKDYDPLAKKHNTGSFRWVKGYLILAESKSDADLRETLVHELATYYVLRELGGIPLVKDDFGMHNWLEDALRFGRDDVPAVFS
ncbi:MAG: hypothetical protein MI919_26155, partial [Holophagales bacterium]|nr:hypothetical protein [Holophagales bacterium]